MDEEEAVRIERVIMWIVFKFVCCNSVVAAWTIVSRDNKAVEGFDSSHGGI